MTNMKSKEINLIIILKFSFLKLDIILKLRMYVIQYKKVNLKIG